MLSDFIQFAASQKFQIQLFEISKKKKSTNKKNKTARISGQSPDCSVYPLIHIDWFLEKENIDNL